MYCQIIRHGTFPDSILIYPVADPEGPLPGGVTKSARSAAGGGFRRGYPPPAGGGPGASPGKMDANGAF